jgi:hypothetical protein
VTLEDTIRTIVREEIEAALQRRASTEWLTAEEFGARIGRHANTVRSYCREGRIPGARRMTARGDYRIPAWAVDRFLEQQERAGEPSAIPMQRALGR